MKKLFTLLLTVTFLSVVATSCGGPDPVKFNDTLVDYIDKAHAQQEKLQEVVSNASDSVTIAAIPQEVTTVIDSLNSYIALVEKLEAAKDGDSLKVNTVMYLKSLVDVTDSYKSFASITENSTEEEVDKISDAIEEKINASQAIFDKIQKEQQSFASKNNMDLR